MEKSKNPRRGRAVGHEAQISPMMPLAPPTIGGGGDIYTETKCPGPDNLDHHHHHHPDARGLAKHAKAFWGWNNAQNTIEEHGAPLILQVLDNLTEQYGDMLDAPPARSKPDDSVWQMKPPPEIKNPAGFILYHVRRAAELAASTPRQIPRHLRDVSSRGAG